MMKRLRNLQIVRANKYEIIPSLALGTVGMICPILVMPVGLEELTISMILCLIAGVFAFNASGDERMGVVGRTLTLAWLALMCLQFMVSFFGIIGMPDGPRA